MSVKQSQKRTISQLYQVGDFIDARDNQGDWRVGYIVDKSDVSKMFKIRFDGWATKYDQVNAVYIFSFIDSGIRSSNSLDRQPWDTQAKNKTQHLDRAGNSPQLNNKKYMFNY